MTDRFLFIGGDKRISYAMRKIAEQFPADKLGAGGVYLEPIGRYSRIVLPFPFSRNGTDINAPLSDTPLPLSAITERSAESAVVFSGGTNAALDKLCRENGLTLVNYAADEALTLKNAQLTAEAAASILINNTEGSLLGADVLITGGGRVAQCTARLLKAFGSNVTVCARNSAQLARAELYGCAAESLRRTDSLLPRCDIVINTIPSGIFTAEKFKEMKSGAVFMELASLPQEPYKTCAEGCGIKYIHAAGLPGKFSPKTAGLLIADFILGYGNS